MQDASQPRRRFLSDLGSGFAGIALAGMLQRDGLLRAETGEWAPPDGKPHFAPKAKSVIWLFMAGGVSQTETFDPKPALNKYNGKTVAQIPIPNPLESDLIKNRLELVKGDANGKIYEKLYGMQVGYGKHGKSGIEVSDWWPHLSKHIDDISVIRSMWTTASNHDAQLQFHTGRNRFDGFFPTIGAWVHYGLGSLNDSLPQFIVMGNKIGDCCGGIATEAANYLGPQHDGVTLSVDPRNPLPFATPAAGVNAEQRLKSQQLLQRLNRLSAKEYTDDPALAARIKSYELAFRMQTSVPDVVNFDSETEATKKLYGFDQKETRPFGQQLLGARRFVERGVRFIQIMHGDGAAGAWDAHGGLKANHTKLAMQVDRPIAGLLKDLKQRGLLDETLVVWGGEFGRQPTAEYAKGTGRDHNAYGFTMWMAGGGIKGGVSVGKTDDLGSAAIEDRMHVRHLHATILQQLGLGPNRLTYFYGGLDRKLVGVEGADPIAQII